MTKYKMKECTKCGSKYDLQRHHDKDQYLPRKHPLKSSHTVVLCRTCHYDEEFDQQMVLRNKALMKLYNKRMDKLVREAGKRLAEEFKED